jgi:hypothetical protein
MVDTRAACRRWPWTILNYYGFPLASAHACRLNSALVIRRPMRSTDCVDNMPESSRMALKDSFVYLRATVPPITCSDTSAAAPIELAREHLGSFAE